jgi:hypothetical protein
LPLQRFGQFALESAICFFRSTSAGARLRLDGVSRAAGSLRTDFPRFAIEVRSGPGKLRIKTENHYQT